MRSLLVLLALSVSLSAPSQTTQPGRIVTTTRLVSMFSGLESDVEKIIQDKNANALNQLVSDDFEVWTPAPPGHPTPREDWWNQASSEKLLSFRIRQMAVRGIADDISVASFVLSETISKPTGRSRAMFVVDVWKKSGDKWQLTDRYAAPLPAHSAAATVDKRPTGKQ